jgi:hypothetical protein
VRQTLSVSDFGPISASRVVVENPTSFWLVVSASVQAAAALAIVWLTSRLVKFTSEYVKEMATANRLQEQGNAISSGLLARSAKEDAPFLISASSGGSGTTGGNATFGMVVENRGGGLAHDIEVDTTWGQGHVPTALGTGDKAQLSFQTDHWVDSDYPQVRAFRFKDVNNTPWVQSPNQAPVQAGTV